MSQATASKENGRKINQDRGSNPKLTSPQTPRTLGLRIHIPSTAQRSMSAAKEFQASDRYSCKSMDDGEIGFVEARKAYHSPSDHDRHLLSSEEDNSQNPIKAKVQFLGIGLGDGCEPGPCNTLDELVSESPTGIDFNT